MAVIRYCWRCDMDIPMLDEAEWAEIEPLLKQGFKEVMAYVAKHHCPLDEAWAKFNSSACRSYFRMTGFAETNHDAIYHHRSSLFGQDCIRCRKPFRTPQARYCVECGFGMESIS